MQLCKIVMNRDEFLDKHCFRIKTRRFSIEFNRFFFFSPRINVILLRFFRWWNRQTTRRYQIIFPQIQIIFAFIGFFHHFRCSKNERRSSFVRLICTENEMILKMIFFFTFLFSRYFGSIDWKSCDERKKIIRHASIRVKGTFKTFL